jgi:Carboxypeptidase regulatory-like domain
MLDQSFARNLLMRSQFRCGLFVLLWVTIACTPPCSGHTPPPPAAPEPEQGPQQDQGRTTATIPAPDQPQPGSITGTVVDESGAVVAGARITVTRPDQSPSLNVLSGNDGQFSFTNISPGPFNLTITAAGFAPQASSATLHPGENYTFPKITLPVATAVTDVEVGLTQTELAAQEIKIEEKQRVFGAIPNFYVSYVRDAAPLNSRQKFKLAWKTVIDPFTLVFVGGAAGVEQAQNHFSEYGQGAEGYAKRFGAGYADTVAGTFIGGAILPSLLKQDPRYFYKGTGSKESRFLYAIASAFVCKGDNGHWQPNYSNVLGSLAAGGLSNLYYPAQDRNGAGLTVENGALGLGATAAANLLQEFLIRKLTPKIPKHDPANP